MLKMFIARARFVYAFARLVRDPNRLDIVFALADGMVGGDRLPDEMRKPEILAYLQAPQQDLVIDIEALRKLPEGTLGRTFAEWLDRRGYMPDALARPHGTSEVQLFKSRMERTHDIWHVVTGFDTDVAGEGGLQAFSMVQLGSPLSLVLIAAILVNTLIMAQEDAARRMDALSRGWFLGKTSKPLFGTDWAALWGTPLDEVRRQLGVVAPATGRTATTQAA